MSIVQAITSVKDLLENLPLNSNSAKTVPYEPKIYFKFSGPQAKKEAVPKVKLYIVQVNPAHHHLGPTKYVHVIGFSPPEWCEMPGS